MDNVLESHIKIDKINNDINNKIFNFITKANELVELSDDDYQIEKNLKLNKISLKQYILDSDCCKKLNDNKIMEYSLDELKTYFFQYSKQFNVDCSKYILAINLYEIIEDIEIQFDKKINLEIQNLAKILSDLNDIKNIKSSDYEQLYFKLKQQLDNYFISQKINQQFLNICIHMLDDIFNYYINGINNLPIFK